MDLKFFVGDEYTGLQHDKIDWVIKTFPQGSYRFVDEGYFYYDQYVVFNETKDALLFKLRWT